MLDVHVKSTNNISNAIVSSMLPRLVIASGCWLASGTHLTRNYYGKGWISKPDSFLLRGMTSRCTWDRMVCLYVRISMVLGLFILVISINACPASWEGMLLIGGKENRSESLRFGKNTAFTEKILNKRKLASFRHRGLLDDTVLFWNIFSAGMQAGMGEV